jgi:AsmA-like C-terminal region
MRILGGRTLSQRAASRSSPGGQSKTALIDLRVKNGRIEDILGLFVKAKRAPMSGSVTLQARTEIPPGERPFLEKVKLKGGFGVGAGSFSKLDTQESVNKLSAGAGGQKDTSDPETVLTDLTGQAALEDGTARFSDLSFGVPGAASRVHGTYNLLLLRNIPCYRATSCNPRSRACFRSLASMRWRFWTSFCAQMVSS